jgi:probable F420-dependent oxidoreductase
VRYSYGPWGATIREFVIASEQAEGAGFSRIWTNELHRSPFVPLAATVSSTSTIGLGTAIALTFVRSPMTTALTALDLDDLSGGRFVLGLGTGVARLNENWHNARFGKPVAHLNESVAVIRKVISSAHLGEPIVVEGEYERVNIRGYERPYPPAREAIPIYIAAVGPRLTELAGAIGDGWISHELCSPLYVRDAALPHLEQGLRSARRKREDLSVVASACCLIDSDSRQAHRLAANLVAFYATVATYQSFFELHGFGEEASRIQSLFREGNHAAVVDACTDEMVDSMMLVGTADEVRNRLASYEGLVDEIKLSPPTHLVPDEVIRSAQSQILSLFS